MRSEEAGLEDCDENKSLGVSHQAGRDALVRPKRGAEQVVNAVRGLANFARQRVLYGRVHLPTIFLGRVVLGVLAVLEGLDADKQILHWL